MNFSFFTIVYIEFFPYLTRKSECILFFVDFVKLK